MGMAIIGRDNYRNILECVCVCETCVGMKGSRILYIIINVISYDERIREKNMFSL